ncbi:MAG: zinc ribbon domain-containing protein [Ktedonobacteraceae bacterium]|jgi:zinc ribbon protein|nr:zinc ribbon domain-containing protein [Ktedonobacteraceae bacterium]
MSDFMESAKNFINATVSRTGWEAQKQMRLRGKQTELDKLLEQRSKLLDELTRAALTQYQQGTLHDPQLSRLCASVIELDHDVTRREEQLQEIKNEQYPADQFAPKPTMDYAPPPVSPSSPQQPGAANQAGMVPCPTCGSSVRANALYCRNCGSKMR